MGEIIALTAALVKPFEGLHRLGPDGLIRPYICPAGYWTRGFGVLCSKDAAPITPAEAEDELFRLLPGYINETLILCPGLKNQSPHTIAAISDFTFNLGAPRLRASTLRRKINAEDWDSARIELKKWVFGGGKRLPGLVARRAAEVQFTKVKS